VGSKLEAVSHQVHYIAIENQTFMNLVSKVVGQVKYKVEEKSSGRNGTSPVVVS